MKKTLFTLIAIIIAPSAILCAQQQLSENQNPNLYVVTTLPDYAFFAQVIGADRVSVEAIVGGNQDAHFIRPKPSFATAVRQADVLVATGLDLELWLQTVINKSGNGKIRSGQPGYVAAATGINLLEKPKTVSRAEGGVHIYGNPHITCSPINMKAAARNIATGLIKNDPAGKDIYLQNLKQLHRQIDERLFGSKLVEMIGGETLCSLAEQDKLIPFLQERKLGAKPLIDYLDGWMNKMLPARGTPIVTYHKNWIYFLKLFGLAEAGTVEPKPGIPPSLKHVTELVTMMRERNIRIILAANYFDQQKVRAVADRTGAKAVIVPLYVGGAPGVDDYFQLVDHWINSLVTAAQSN